MRKICLFIIFVTVALFIVACGANIVQKQKKLLSDADFSENDDQHIRLANQQLAWDVLADLYEEDENLFVSPLSLFFALSMTYEAADGDTKEQMANVMHVDGLSDQEIRSANAALLNKLLSSTKELDLHVANSIWLNEDFTFQADFIDKNKHYYTAEVAEVDFTDQKAVEDINKWIKKMTNKKITNMIEEPPGKDNITSLFNTIYFQADWLDEFDGEQNKTDSFYLADGEMKKVEYMLQEANYQYYESDQEQMIRIPYKSDDVAMYVWVPAFEESLRTWLPNQDLSKLMQMIDDMKEDRVILQMPHFTLEDKYDFVTFLSNRGMTDAFTPGKADLPYLIEEGDGVVISDVVQKSYIAVEEEGVEAAVATEVSMKVVSAPVDEDDLPKHMTLNRPFMFMIIDERTEIPLFVGVVETP